MASDSLILDETMCPMPVCQHPLCWASMRRLGRGRPRYMQRKPCSSFESTSEDEDELPTVKFVTLPSYQPHFIEGSLRSPSLPRSCPTWMELEHSYDPYAYETPPCSFSSRSANFSLDKINFPGLNSTKDFEKLLQRNRRFVSQGKVQKLDVIDLDDCGISGSGHDSSVNKLSVVWVPETKKCQRQRYQEGNRVQQTLRVGIKELSVEVPEASDINRLSVCRTNRKSSKKIPTGGQPYSLPMVVINPNHPCTRSLPEKVSSSDMKTKVKQSFSTDEGSSEDPLLQRHSSCRHAKNPAIEVPNSPFLDNRKMILHQVKERHSHTYPVQNGSPRYIMDEKPPRVLKVMEIDPESIKNQPYLWKKYIDGTAPSRKIRVSRHCAHKVHPEMSFGCLGGLGLFPSPDSTSRTCQKKHVVELPDGSTTSKVEVSSYNSKAGSTVLTSVSEESKLIPPLKTTHLFSKEFQLNMDLLSEFSEDENHTSHLMEQLRENESVKSEADLNEEEGTETPEQRSAVWNDDGAQPGKGEQAEEHPETSAQPSSNLDEWKQNAQSNNNKKLEKGEKAQFASPRPPPPPPSPEYLGKGRFSGEENQPELELAAPST